jgi:membrane-bound serine protease (ClpP class)
MELTLAYVLIGVGFLLLGLELFVPSGGLLFVTACGSIIGGLVLVFQTDTLLGVFTLIGVFVALPVLGGLLLYIWPRTALGRRFLVRGTAESDTVAAMPANQELERLKGRFGRTLAPLRPAGVVDFDGRRVDTLTEGMMVEEGQWVRCIDVRAGKVIVRPVERPDLGALDGTDFGDQPEQGIQRGQP